MYYFLQNSIKYFKCSCRHKQNVQCKGTLFFFSLQSYIFFSDHAYTRFFTPAHTPLPSLQMTSQLCRRSHQSVLQKYISFLRTNTQSVLQKYIFFLRTNITLQLRFTQPWWHFFWKNATGFNVSYIVYINQVRVTLMKDLQRQ